MIDVETATQVTNLQAQIANQQNQIVALTDRLGKINVAQESSLRERCLEMAVSNSRGHSAQSHIDEATRFYDWITKLT